MLIEKPDHDTRGYILADVFTETPFGGNQLAVFPDGGGLSTATMQAVAGELNLSETVFVQPPSGTAETVDLRIFTPGGELPFAGHPTIGAALVLQACGALKGARNVTKSGEQSIDIILGEQVGPVPVRIETGEGRQRAVLTSPRSPTRLAGGPAAEVLERLLGLPADAMDASAAAVYSAGLPFLLVPVRDRAGLSAIRFDSGVWERALKESPARAAYPFLPPQAGCAGIIHARMFAPKMGIVEDPATGSAAAALAGYLAADGTVPLPTGGWTIHQGDDMGRPSRIDLEIDAGSTGSMVVRVGGSAVMMGEGRLFLPRM